MTATGKYLNLKIDPFLVYPGAKWAMAEWIVGHLPPHKIYLEPFAGSGAVFFNKEPSAIETLNDINSDIFNLFTVMRENLDELIAAIELTPWSREEFELSYIRGGGLPPVERARRFLVQCWQAHKPKHGERTGWKKETTGAARKNYTRQWDRLPGRISAAAGRLLQAQIENRNGMDVIKWHRSENVLIYADPPYILTTRTRGLYKDELHIQEHETLLRLLCDHPGPVLLSSLHHDLYERLLKGWEKKLFMTNAASGKRYEEILWINPKAMEMLK